MDEQAAGNFSNFYDGCESNFMIFLIEDVATHLLSHLADTLDTGAVQVTVVLAGLDESMALDVLLHLFP